MDDSLINNINIDNDSAIYIINTNKKIYNKDNYIIIDATKIAINKLGFNQPNTVILGILANIFNINTNKFDKYFKTQSNLSENIIDANISAFKEGWNYLNNV